jgi:hypothetical protein
MVLALAVLPALASAQAEKKLDLTGKWTFSVHSELGTGTPTVTLKQQGDSLTGRYSSQTLGESDLKGTFKDQKIAFSFTSTVEGQSFTVSFAGAVEGEGLKGTVDFGGMGGGTFTAKRQP